MAKADGSNEISEREFLSISAELVRAERDIRDATTVAAAARGVKSGILKRAKKLGANVDALKSLASLAAMDDDDRIELLRDTARYAAWQGVPLWVAGNDEMPQGALFGGDAETLESRQIYNDAMTAAQAWEARRAGDKEYDNPHPAGSREHQTWATTWRDADTELAGKPAVGKKADATPRKATPPAEPKKRGRPPGKKAAADEIGEPVGSA